ncbi:MAG: murein L,D-transpeptidase YafK [Verrucomicrobiales bacterium]|jgi:murein L,D-transpeptidase YafK
MIVVGVGIAWVFVERETIVSRIQELMRGGESGENPRPEYASSSEKAAAAAARTKPVLEADMKGLGLRLGDPIFIRIFKETNELEVWVEKPDRSEFELYSVYRICKRSGTLGPKRKPNDGQAPEGFYFMIHQNLDPASRNHLALDLGFPNQFDRALGREGIATIHGGCEASSGFAMTDKVIEDLFTLAAVSLESPPNFFHVHCFPFRMTDARMDQAVQENPSLINFWANLKEGFDYFEIVRRPPNTTLLDGVYVFE